MSFPFGPQQTLSIGTLSLTLTEEEFAAEDADGLAGVIGFDRFENLEQKVSTARAASGSSVWSGPSFEPGHRFIWSLYLDDLQLYTLAAIQKEQQHRIRNQIAGGSVRLKDQRLAFLARSPRNRAKVGTISGAPAAPGGYEYFYPQFDILLELPEDFLSLHLGKGKAKYLVGFTATELDLVPTSEDAA